MSHQNYPDVLYRLSYVLCGRLKHNLFHTQVANLFIHILFYRQVVKDELAVSPQRTTVKTTGNPRIKYSCCCAFVLYLVVRFIDKFRAFAIKTKFDILMSSPFSILEIYGLFLPTSSAKSF